MKRRAFIARLVGAAAAPLLPEAASQATSIFLDALPKRDGVMTVLGWESSLVLGTRVNPFHALIGGPNGKRPISEVMDFKRVPQ